MHKRKRFKKLSANQVYRYNGDRRPLSLKTFILNDDVLKMILSYLDIREKSRLQRVCSQFCSCVKELFRRQKILSIGSVCDPLLADQYVFDRYNYKLKDISISGSFDMSSNRSLSFNTIDNFKTLSALFRKCPNIEFIFFNHFSVDKRFVEWITFHFPKLEGLKFELMKSHLRYYEWAYIGKYTLNNLSHLQIDCQYIINDGINSLIANLTSMQKLIIRNYPKPIKHLFKNIGPQLRQLAMDSCYRLTLEDVKVLSRRTKSGITFLSIINEKEVEIVNEDNNEVAVNHIQLDNETNNNLDLKSNQTIILIGEHFINLQNFTYQCNCFSTFSFKKFIGLQNLNSLYIRIKYRRFIDFSLFDVFVFENLVDIRLKNASFTPNMLKNINRKIPHLKNLKLCNHRFYCKDTINCHTCEECVDQCILFLSKLPELRQLELHFENKSIEMFIIRSIRSIPLFNRISSIALPQSQISGLSREVHIKAIVETCAQLATIHPNRNIQIRVCHNFCSQISKNHSKGIARNMKIIPF